MELGPSQLKIFEILRNNFGFNPEINTVIFYNKKIKNNKLTLEELSDILNRENSQNSQQHKNEFNIDYFEKKIFSQNGEDGIINFIFSTIGTHNKFFVEFGVKNGTECNTRYLLEKKDWTGLMMDENPNQSKKIKKEFVTPENINDLLKKYEVPHKFDLLSIDIDYNDYWVWESIKGFYPRVVVIEYNSSIPPNESKVIEYDLNDKWDKTNYFGASLLALVKLGKNKGYELVGCDSNGINAFFIQREIVKGLIKRTYSQMYKPPQYGQLINGKHIGHPFSKRKMMEI